MSAPTIRPGLEHFCESWNSLIETLKTNYLVEPLLNRKINCETIEGEKYAITLTDSDAALTEAEDRWAHATFRIDTEGWQDLLHGKLNFLTLAMQGKMRTSMDEALKIHPKEKVARAVELINNLEAVEDTSELCRLL